MEHRYSLRFESGERRGESIPITGAGLTIGRKPGNTLQILDNSVSGNHAELVVDDEGVLVRDSGSTNGTRIGSQRVIEQILSDGDEVLFGNVRLTFHDAGEGAGGAGRASGARPAAGRADAARGETVRTTMEGIELEGLDMVTGSPAAEAAADDAVTRDAVLRVNPELMARSRKRSMAGGLLVVALALVGGGVWWWLNKSGRGSAEAGRLVEPVAGNLIPQGFSFEGDEEAWVAAESGSAAFLKSGGSRRSGAFGVGADLEAGQWALHRSQSVRASAGRELSARGYLRTRGDCEGRVGIELSNDLFSDAAAPASVIAWCDPVTDSGAFGPVEVTTVVPPGWSQARVVLLARARGADGGGSVDADDVSLVETGRETQPAVSVGQAALYLLGEPPRSAQLVRGPRALVTHIATASAADEAEPWDETPLSARADGLELFVQPAHSGAAAMQLRAEEPLAHARIATIAKEGYTTHGLDFERAGVEALLLGSGADLVRVKLAGPSQVKGKAQGPATRITIVPAQPLEMQLDFAAERKEAGNIAYAARASEASGKLGAAVVQWTALLDGYPFDDALVNEAEAARSRLVQKGLGDLRRVQAEVERARFFRLADLYRKSRTEALAVGELFKGSEVETQARALAAAVAEDIAALEVDLHKTERERMRSILAALEARQATGLAAQMRAYMAEKFGAAQSNPGKAGATQSGNEKDGMRDGAKKGASAENGAGRAGDEDGMQKSGDEK